MSTISNMRIMSALINEIRFTAKDRSIWLWLVLVFSLSVLSVGFGLSEVKQQHETIDHLIEADKEDRLTESKKYKSWGSAAYYSFHLTYDTPSDFAFAAMGQRDSQPWKHRIRMLALEGQIYERDSGNPSTALIGRFDFAFLAAFIIPLVLIMLLYDLRASERTAGRYNLIEATLGQAKSFWLMRAGIRAGGLFICLVIPLIIAGMIASTSLSTLLLACGFVLAYTLFWTLICYVLSAWQKTSSMILMTLVAIWVSVSVIVPAASRLAIDKLVPLPTGAEILLLQRETVNDAWDLPKKTTMDAFFAKHPEWTHYKPVKSSFEWQWYYAFQQVGDQQATELSTAYRDGRLKRDQLASWISLLTPPSLLERSLQSLANTDLKASIAYENQVRNYHGALRAFYYPKFFNNEPFDIAQWKPVDFVGSR